MSVLTGGLAHAKLTIQVYLDREMGGAPVASMDAMYNPETIELNYTTQYDADSFINSIRQTSRYQRVQPGTLRLDLLFDATLPENRSASIDSQLDLLRNLCSAADAKTGETRFLRISWGKMTFNGRGYFAGRMESLAIRYAMFDRDGTPVRAFATLGIAADESLVLQQSKASLSAASHRVSTAQVLDTLPLIAAQIGPLAPGRTADYLDLAYANDLDNIRSVPPGTRLAVKTGPVGL